MAMLFAATYPGRTIALIASGCSPRYAWAADFPWGEKPEQFEEYLADNRERWGTNGWAADQLRAWAAPSLADDPLAIEAFATFVRLGRARARRRRSNG